jgi:hypothetical protein
MGELRWRGADAASSLVCWESGVKDTGRKELQYTGLAKRVMPTYIYIVRCMECDVGANGKLFVIFERCGRSTSSMIFQIPRSRSGLCTNAAMILDRGNPE